MKIRQAAAALCICAAAGLTGCGVKSGGSIDGLTQEEQERQAISQWFSVGITDSDDFPDLKDYQYYARALGKDKDFFLERGMWEVFYSEEMNINREIDEKALYLIRLDPEKLLEIYAERNECTVDEICAELSLTAEQLYYNWGYTASAADYSKNHKKGLSAYSEMEAKIFGRDNGENRQTVMSTHFLSIDTDGNSIAYLSEPPEEIGIRQRDMLHVTTKDTYDYSIYTEEERNPAFAVNGIGIRRVLPLSLPNAWYEAQDKDITVMFNASPFSYGCTDEDKIAYIVQEESEITEEMPASDTESETTAEIEETSESETSGITGEEVDN